VAARRTKKRQPKTQEVRGQTATEAAVAEPRWLRILSFSIMLAGVLAVYASPAVLAGKELLWGYDYWHLHAHRIQYAQDAWRGGHPLPGWYSRELLGTPFWGNIQNFPWIPTRFLLLLFDTSHAYVVGALLAALLAAVFTYLFARKAGQGAIGGAATGWTFACAGFFASRLLAGHLPVLEAYPALPLLLWLIERESGPPKAGRWSPAALLSLAAASACVALAGHPQLPFYALAAATAYAVWRMRSRRCWMPLAAMAGGVSCSLFAWWPMLKLIGRSNRLVSLQGARNDVPLVLGRLKALVLPWADGWPDAVSRMPAKAFSGFPGDPYFWDTVSYVGLLPLVAILLLGVEVVVRRKVPGPIPLFFVLLGSVSLLTALPFVQGLQQVLPITFLRSSSRQLYLVAFCLSFALGWAVQEVLGWGRGPGRKWAVAVVLLSLAAHGADLGRHDRSFLRALPASRGAVIPELESLLEKEVGDARVGFDHVLFLRCNREFDDVGFFDSLCLLRPYQAVLSQAGRSHDENVETLDACKLPAKFLAETCVKYVVTRAPRGEDLILRGNLGMGKLYEVPGVAPRAGFVPDQPAVTGSAAPSVLYERPSSDTIVVHTKADAGGTLKLVESWDPGWSARLDGAPAPVSAVEGFLLGVKVPAGEHTVLLSYRTPGLRTGLALSLLGLASVALLLLLRWKQPSGPESPSPV
jgi:hypothetical protein